VAAALGGQARGPTVCVVSGGNIDLAVLAAILQGRTPRRAGCPARPLYPNWQLPA
jgi:threonine dehydratase